jgi:hypothetical protein
MKGTFTFAFLIVFLICTHSCSNEKNDASQTQQKKSFSSNIDSLARFIDLKAYPPKNVMWQYRSLSHYPDNRVSVAGPTDYVLEAFVQYDRQTADKLKQENTNFIGNGRIATEEYLFEWLPEDLIIKGKTDSSWVYNTSSFAKAPLLEGSYLFLNPTTILLSLQTQ